jgi:hypothetical protein
MHRAGGRSSNGVQRATEEKEGAHKGKYFHICSFAGAPLKLNKFPSLFLPDSDSSLFRRGPSHYSVGGQLFLAAILDNRYWPTTARNVTYEMGMTIASPTSWRTKASSRTRHTAGGQDSADRASDDHADRSANHRGDKEKQQPRFEVIEFFKLFHIARVRSRLSAIRRR